MVFLWIMIEFRDVFNVVLKCWIVLKRSVCE